MMPRLERQPEAPTAVTPSMRGLVSFKSNAQIDAEQQAKYDAQQAQSQPVITSLAAEIGRRWEEARSARLPIERRMIECLRRRNGEYSPEKLAAIRETGGSEVYMMLTNIKCRAAEAWVNDVLFPAGDKPWKLKPTTEPEISPLLEEEIKGAVMQEASVYMQQMQVVLPPEAIKARLSQVKDEIKKRLKQRANDVAKRMSDRITDQFEEGNWETAMREVVRDVVTFPAGILKGPVIRRRKSLKWERRAGAWVPIVANVLRPEWYRVSPLDLYPSPSARHLNDGYLFERHRLSPSELLAMKGVPGYNDQAIDLVLTEYRNSGLRDWLWNDNERARLEHRPNEFLSRPDTIDAIEFRGRMQGKKLLEWGMSADQVKDPLAEYEVEAWKIGSYVIRAVLNDDLLGLRPYDKASFEEIPGAFWGLGVPELMSDLQDVCNAAARSLVNNMAMGSGPQAEVHGDRLAVGEDITAIHPYKIWQTVSDPNGTNNPAVRFFQPEIYAQPLIRVYEFFSALADEYTGIPKYAYGDGGTGGAGATASGLSMLMSAAARGIKQVISHLDKPIEGSVGRMYIFNMLNDPDDTIKGDLKPVAQGSRSLIAKEQQMIRLNELLLQTNNPVDLSITGPEGRARLLREAIKNFDIPIDDVVPDPDNVINKMKSEMASVMQQQQMAAGALPPGQAPGGATLDAAGNPAGGGDFSTFQGAAA